MVDLKKFDGFVKDLRSHLKELTGVADDRYSGEQRYVWLANAAFAFSKQYLLRQEIDGETPEDFRREYEASYFSQMERIKREGVRGAVFTVDALVLVVLGITVTAIGAALLKTRPKVLHQPAGEHATAEGEPQVLTMLVPAVQGQKLRSGSRLDARDAERLEEAYTWSWYGTQREFEGRGMAEWLRQPHPGKDDAFHVYCVVLNLYAYDPRFSSAASPLSRHEAFAELPARVSSIQVIGPMSADALKGRLDFKHA